MAERSKFQFRMRDLLWAVSLIGVAFGLGLALRRTFLLLWQTDEHDDAKIALILLLGPVGVFACFGAGMGCLIRKPIWGALAGAAIGQLTGCTTCWGVWVDAAMSM